jgi:UDP-N-acetylglucosamine:LPS N-acetylglucosamine transferase
MRNHLRRRQTTVRVSLAALLVVAAAGRANATGSMATARNEHTATVLGDGTVLIVGGSNGVPLASAEIYNPVAGTFSPTGSLATARGSFTATLLADGRVLVVGGFNYEVGSGILASAEIYDPVGGTFSPTGSLATARNAHTATPLADGTVLVVGGSNGTAPLASAEVYDPSTGPWR